MEKTTYPKTMTLQVKEAELRTCGTCELYHNGCEFSETETEDNNIKDFVACGQFVKREAPFVIEYGYPKPLTIVINCETIILKQERIGIEIEVTEALKKANTIIVNGAKFERRADNEQREAD